MGAMRPPDGLDATGRAAFRDAAAVLAAIGEDPELCAGAIRRYAAAVSEARLLEREWRAKEGVKGVRKGPRGGIAPEPLLSAIDRAERRAQELAAELGLTPAARRRIGRQVQGGRPQGAASAPDRAAGARLGPNVIPLEVRRALGDAG